MAYGDENYIHYYFSNYVAFQSINATQALAQITEKSRTDILQRQLDAYRLRKEENMSSASDINGIEELFSADYWNDILRTSDSYTASSTNTINPMDVSQYSSVQLDAIAEQLTNNLERFCDSINNFATSVQKTVEDKGFKEAYNQAVIEDFARTGTRPASAEGNSIINNLLKTDGFKTISNKINNPIAKIENVVQNLLALADNLPSYISQKGYNKDYTVSPKRGGRKIGQESKIVQFYNKVISKISDAKIYLQETLEQLSQGVGLTNSMSLAAKKVREVNQSFRSNSASVASSGQGLNISCDMNVVEDSSLKSIYLRPYATTKKGNNVQLSIANDAEGNGQVVFKMGFDVYNYKTRPSDQSNVMSYSISKSESFGDFYRSLFPLDSRFMFIKSLGAGHGDGNMRGQARSRRMGTYTNAQLTQYWSELVRSVAITNLAMTFATNIREDTLFLVLNGKVIGIDTVLESLLSYIGQEQRGKAGQISDFGYGYLLKGLSRSKMLKASQWTGSDNPNQDDASIRSDSATPELESMLQTAKLFVSLRMLSSVLNR